MNNKTNTIKAIIVAVVLSLASPALGQDAGIGRFVVRPSIEPVLPGPLIIVETQVLRPGSTLFFEFTSVGNSGVLQIKAPFARICLNTDLETEEDSGARARIRYVMTSPTAAGSTVIGDLLLDGRSGGTDCIDDIPSGRYFAEIVTAPSGGATAAIIATGNRGGTPRVIGNERTFRTSLALGEIFTDSNPWTPTFKFGQNPSVGIDPEDVWDCPELGADDFYPFLLAPDTLFVSSDSDADAGATTVLLQGLDANWDFQEQIAVLGADAGTGTTSVQIGDTDNWIRIQSVQNVGATETVGNVYVHNGVDVDGNGVPDDLGDIRGCWRALWQRSAMMVYSVPNGHAALLEAWGFGVTQDGSAATKSVELHLRIRAFGTVFAVVGINGVITSGTSSLDIPLRTNPAIPPKADVVVRATNILGMGSSVFSRLDLVTVPQ